MKHVLMVVLVLLVGGMTYLFTRGALLADEFNRGDDSITVEVNDEHGIALMNASLVIISDQNDRSVTVNQREEDGRFIMNVLPGAYTVTARAEGYISDTQQVTVTEETPASLIFNLSKTAAP